MTCQHQFITVADCSESIIDAESHFPTKSFLQEMGNVIAARDNVVRYLLTAITNRWYPPQQTFKINEEFFREEFV